ncbi:hypothetical protein LMG7141_00804 [Ralstonia condita]|uniref:Glycosyltransferase 2-like domain-containing protein n=1 Tax=Ralstonia condita TaxID=3058600 RepID=A0ABN9IH03_9RALS|nr:hypothetical protein [Ralstonia sp. LMG 7141]CAJ0778823.1 hypothetical protein LMG7141_00804 [Ralstonia sp. LMG 7141]
MKRVAICIPSPDMVHADFAMSLAAMAYRCSGFTQGGQQFEAIPIAIINTKGSLVANNRNRLVKEARELGVDYLLFLDSDMVFHVDTLRRLLSHDKDIVGGTYIQREDPHRLLGKTVDGQMLHEAMSGLQVDLGGLMEVGALPGGCLLVKMSVFDDMVHLPFQTPAHFENEEPWIEGEDYFFCRMAREAGNQVWLDWSVSFHLRHIGQTHNAIPAVQVQPEEAHAIVH